MKSGEGLHIVYNSISELHRSMGGPPPLHPLVSLMDFGSMQPVPEGCRSIVYNLYKISFVNSSSKIDKMKYGQHWYDFEQGGLCFISPGQVLRDGNISRSLSGTSLYFHPDFIRKFPLGKKIKEYGFFSYEVSESLHLSEREKETILLLFQQIRQELELSIDLFSQDLLISYIELLLNYSNRFYNRQFITRQSADNDLLARLETLLNAYFDNDQALLSGLPTVQYISDQLHFSPDYLSDMLRTCTGQNTQQHIHNKLIEKAKELLLSGNLNMTEVAYQLGFEHPQSFNRFFKRLTSQTPSSYRQAFLIK